MVRKMLCLYPTGGVIQEESLLMKEKMIETNPEFGGFHASNGWLESFKTMYGRYFHQTERTAMGISYGRDLCQLFYGTFLNKFVARL